MAFPGSAFNILFLSIPFFLYIRHLRKSRRQLPLPPGPAKLPLFGNALSVPLKPEEKPNLYYDSLSKRYGPVISLNLAGQCVIVLTSHEAAHELLSKRAKNYSDRPRFPNLELLEDLPPWQSRYPLSRQYDAAYRLHRRVLASGMSQTAARRWYGLIELETLQMVRDLLRDQVVAHSGTVTSDFVYRHLKRAENSSLLGLQYGIRVHEYNDQIAQTNNEAVSLAMGRSALDVFPWLTRLPATLSPWRRRAMAVRVKIECLYPPMFARALTLPGWNMAKQAHAIGTREGIPLLDTSVNVEGSVEAGIEATPRSLMWFFVAAINFPNVLRTAQNLIDQRIGRDRLPTFADRQCLPFIYALVYELGRWRQIEPVGVPHRVKEDDEYAGFRIPAGALVFAPSWSIGRDPAVFGSKDVEDFVPERWMVDRNPSGDLRIDLPWPVWGYGSRACPGRRFAEDFMFLAIARLLWAFDILPGIDPDSGATVPVDSTKICGAGFATIPMPFVLTLKPRMPCVRMLEVVDREWDVVETDIAKIFGDMDDRMG